MTDSNNRIKHVRNYYAEKAETRKQKMKEFFKQSNIYQKFVQEQQEEVRDTAEFHQVENTLHTWETRMTDLHKKYDQLSSTIKAQEQDAQTLHKLIREGKAHTAFANVGNASNGTALGDVNNGTNATLAHVNTEKADESATKSWAQIFNASNGTAAAFIQNASNGTAASFIQNASNGTAGSFLQNQTNVTLAVRPSNSKLIQIGHIEYPTPDQRGPIPQNAHPDSTFSSHLHNDWTHVQLEDNLNELEPGYWGEPIMDNRMFSYEEPGDF